MPPSYENVHSRVQNTPALQAIYYCVEIETVYCWQVCGSKKKLPWGIAHLRLQPQSCGTLFLC